MCYCVCYLVRRLLEVLRRLYAGGIEWGFTGINDPIAVEVLVEMKETDCDACKPHPMEGVYYFHGCALWHDSTRTISGA